MKADMVAAMASQECPLGAKWDAKGKVEMAKIECGGQKMKRMMAAGMAVVVIAVILVGAAVAGANGGRSDSASARGSMPEVVVTAEMPRLVMPMVEVVGVRTVAMSGSDLRVN